MRTIQQIREQDGITWPNDTVILKTNELWHLLAIAEAVETVYWDDCTETCNDLNAALIAARAAGLFGEVKP